MSGFVYTPNQPIGERTGTALVCGQGRAAVRAVAAPVYAPDVVERAERLRALRLRFDLSLREAAKELSMRGAELSAIETGEKSIDYDDCGDLEGFESVAMRVERAYRLAAAVKKAGV